MSNERKIILVSVLITLTIQFLGALVLGYVLSPGETGYGCGGVHSNLYDCKFPEVIEVVLLQVVVVNLGSMGLVSFFIFMVSYALLRLRSKSGAATRQTKI